MVSYAVGVMQLACWQIVDYKFKVYKHNYQQVVSFPVLQDEPLVELPVVARTSGRG
jgi:hypothetical protein